MKTHVMKHDQIEPVAVAASKATWAGAWVAGIFGGLSIHEGVAVGGFLIAVIGFMVNLYYRRRADKRAERLFELRERRLLAGRSDPIPLDEPED